MSRAKARRLRREALLDGRAYAEGLAVRRLHGIAPKRKDARVTASIHYAPKKPGGVKGWLVMTQSREMSSQPVRNASHRTPKLVNSYVRCFPVVT